MWECGKTLYSRGFVGNYSSKKIKVKKLKLMGVVRHGERQLFRLPPGQPLVRLPPSKSFTAPNEERYNLFVSSRKHTIGNKILPVATGKNVGKNPTGYPTTHRQASAPPPAHLPTNIPTPQGATHGQDHAGGNSRCFHVIGSSSGIGKTSNYFSDFECSGITESDHVIQEFLVKTGNKRSK